MTPKTGRKLTAQLLPEGMRSVHVFSREKWQDLRLWLWLQAEKVAERIVSKRIPQAVQKVRTFWQSGVCAASRTLGLLSRRHVLLWCEIRHYGPPR